MGWRWQLHFGKALLFVRLLVPALVQNPFGGESPAPLSVEAIPVTDRPEDEALRDWISAFRRKPASYFQTAIRDEESFHPQ